MPGQLLSICELKESVRNCGVVSTVELAVENYTSIEIALVC